MKLATLPPAVAPQLYTGVVAAATPALARALVARSDRPVAVLFAASAKLAEQWVEDLGFYAELMGDEALQVAFLAEEPEHPEDDPRAFELACDRLAALTDLIAWRDHPPGGDRRLLVVTTPRAFFARAPKPDDLGAREMRLQVGDTVDLEALAHRLATELDYDAEAVCETPGQFARRGGLLDVYPLNGDAPLRLDFFGDEIEDIRTFDPTTQRSLEARQVAVIAPAPSQTGGWRERHIFAYFGHRVTWLMAEPAAVAEAYPPYFEVFEKIPNQLPHFAELADDRHGADDAWVGLAEFAEDAPLFGDAAVHELSTSGLDEARTMPLDRAFGIDRMEAEQEARSAFLHTLARWQQEGDRVIMVTHNEGEEQRLREVLAETPRLPKTFQPTFLRGAVHEGFRARPGMAGPETEGDGEFPLASLAGKPGRGVALVTANEIFGRYRTRAIVGRRRRMPQRKAVDQLLDFTELADGDYLVHLNHGICIYRGLQKMELRGKAEEVIVLEFDEGLTLYLPLHESHLLTRYVGLAKHRPKLGRLGTNQWEKTRHAAEKATLDFAADLLKLQAEREAGKGFAFPPDNEWQREFEASFIHQETPDQLNAIQVTKADLEAPQATDRLICGDVGFGKTEVALRAAFKAVMGGRQVALLVPTTVLAQQHFHTFRERMADYPVTVEMVSRFRTKQEQAEILKQVQAGQIDILIGTHRLLSKDVNFGRLGLLIIDEEHRFGVRHKEKLKRLRADVDVITMSATPIPRTLYLALMGARDLSVIETPPQDRLPIQTIVRAYDEQLVKRAIESELERGGQVFYLHNRVQTIDTVAAKLNELLPKARIAVGHGQMTEHTLEKIMTRFVAGEYDVLVCTTIIESGLDIPNCNTIIIEGADRFGLAQLYQLRGRVGRFKRQAYAYLLLHRHTHILDQARKRLSAMRQYNQLGAGFKIAMRDLELRGAGNLLGAQQSGHIAGVGFDLYCQLLRQSIARLKGEPLAQRVRAQVRLDFLNVGGDEQFLTDPDAKPANAGPSKDGFAVLKDEELADGTIPAISAYLPIAYLDEPRLRIEFYRKLALAEDLDAVKQVARELKDRFGDYPPPVEALLLLAEIRCLAEQNGLQSVETEGNRLKLRRASGQRDDFVKVGHRFPRLQKRTALLRLREVRRYLKSTLSST